MYPTILDQTRALNGTRTRGRRKQRIPVTLSRVGTREIVHAQEVVCDATVITAGQVSVRDGRNSRLVSTRFELPDGWVQLSNRNGYLYQPTGTRVTSRRGLMEHQELMQQQRATSHQELLTHRPSSPARTVEMSSRDASQDGSSDGDGECVDDDSDPEHPTLYDCEGLRRGVEESERLEEGERDSAQPEEDGNALSVVTAAWEADLKLLEEAQAEIVKLRNAPPGQSMLEEYRHASEKDAAQILSMVKEIDRMKIALDTNRATQLAAKQATFSALRASKERMIDIRNVEEELRVISLVKMHEVEKYLTHMKGRIAAAVLRLERPLPLSSVISSEVNHGKDWEGGAVTKAVHQSLIKEFAKTFRPSRTSRDDKALRFLLDEYTKQQKMPSDLYAAVQQRSVVHTWTDSEELVHCLATDPLGLVDTSQLRDLVLEGGELLTVRIMDGKSVQQDAEACRQLVTFFGAVLFVKEKEYIKSLLTADHSLTLTIRRNSDGVSNGDSRSGSFIAACTYSLAKMLDNSTVLYINLYHCQKSCRTLRMAKGMEWPSLKLLTTCVLTCRSSRVHVLAQSVGYTYAMSELSGAINPVITMQEVKADEGRQFWKKHLDKTHDGFVIGAQLVFTSDVQVYGDCCFLHRCFDLKEA